MSGIYHGNTIGNGVIIVTPSVLPDKDGSVLVVNQDGSTEYGDPSQIATIYSADGVIDEPRKVTCSQNATSLIFQSFGGIVFGDADAERSGFTVTINAQIGWFQMTNQFSGEMMIMQPHVIQGITDGKRLNISAPSGGIGLTEDVFFWAGAQFGDETITKPTGTTVSIDLAGKNHQTLDLSEATGDVTVTLQVPMGSASGSLVILQGTTARKVTFEAASGAVEWWTDEPTYDDDANTSRPVSWRYDGNRIGLMSVVAMPEVTGTVDWINVQDYGADGIASEDDDAPAIMAAIADLPEGGTLYFPAGVYTLVTAVDLPDSCVVRGAGPGSLIRSGLEQWINRGDGTGLGLLNFLGTLRNALITNLRFSGRVDEWQKETIGDRKEGYPLGIYAAPRQAGTYRGNGEGLIITSCWFEDFNFETLWNSTRAIVTNCDFYNCGRCQIVLDPPWDWRALPVAQFFDDHCVYVANTFRFVGMGINTGGAVTITGNSIVDTKGHAISHGDGVGMEACSITGNYVESDSNADYQVCGVVLGGAKAGNPVRIGNVTGNTINLTGKVGDLIPAGIKCTTNERALIGNNAIHMDGYGIGISIQSPNEIPVEHHLTNNRIEWSNEPPALFATGIEAVANNGRDMTIWSRGNSVSGLTTAGSNYAYRFIATGTGIMRAHSRGDYVEDGFIAFGFDNANAILKAAGELSGRIFDLDSPDPELKPDYKALAEFEKLLFTPDPSTGLTLPGGILDLSSQSKRVRYNIRWGAGNDLHTIEGIEEGDILIIQLVHDPTTNREITVHHSAGNIILKNELDLTLKTGPDNQGPRRLMFDVDDQLVCHEL